MCQSAGQYECNRMREWVVRSVCVNKCVDQSASWGRGQKILQVWFVTPESSLLRCAASLMSSHLTPFISCTKGKHRQQERAWQRIPKTPCFICVDEYSFLFYSWYVTFSITDVPKNRVSKQQEAAWRPVEMLRWLLLFYICNLFSLLFKLGPD